LSKAKARTVGSIKGDIAHLDSETSMLMRPVSVQSGVEPLTESLKQMIGGSMKAGGPAPLVVHPGTETQAQERIPNEGSGSNATRYGQYLNKGSLSRPLIVLE
jgi:hypothetical protein